MQTVTASLPACLGLGFAIGKANCDIFGIRKPTPYMCQFYIFKPSASHM